ncbi:PAS domain S-box-containing protein/diguanylate cyclase (GGDEF) domain-containing protein [Marinospirillum celere]|uniref:diguanylate cyclase n=1 Tax=Marinospirillum celere TaxID=1122252 RepID=A0A1I1ENJ4_9GAMM|nr:sensor domain-containing diguanylate cyclase [Marinospirillum celere]SFB88236.1 PAS domain S-box-containing protein/diguanylate cyclase (GGDEF) domain-containing protein [Marinospirillum celere]
MSSSFLEATQTTLQSLKLLWQHSPDTMFVIEKRQQRYYLIDFNPAQERAFRDQLCPGLALDEILPKEMWQAIQERYDKCLKTRQPMSYEEKGFGENYWSTLLVPLVDEKGTAEYIAGVSRNISDLKKTEQLLREEMQRAESLNTQYEKLNAELESKVLERTQALEELAVTDRLTGLFNRHKLDRELADEIKRAERYSRPFGLILLDIDNFKLINDTYGHLAGDQVLVLIASVLQSNTRTTDVLGRWGGEEFLVLCTESNLEGLLHFAKKLRCVLANQTMPFGGSLTASLGVALYKKGDSAEQLVSRADRALYHAKSNGRNCVEHLDQGFV